VDEVVDHGGKRVGEHRQRAPSRPGSFVFMTDVHLSPDAFKRLQDEFEDLTTRGRVEVAQRIEAARALGDLSENGDYHAAKDDQGKMEARIRQIEALLRTATIVDTAAASGGVIGTGSVVSLQYEG